MKHIDVQIEIEKGKKEKKNKRNKSKKAIKKKTHKGIRRFAG